MSTKILGTIDGVDETTRSVGIIASTPQPVQGEALVSWDLTRFMKNPVILFAHDLTKIPVGTAYDIVASPEALKMRVRFATESANPEAEKIWNCVKQQIVRGVSVQCELGTARKVAGGVTEYSDNVLVETSFVPVPADEDALVIENEEARKKSVSAAASALAKSKQSRTDAGETVQRLDRSSLGKVKRTQVGGARVPARLSRTGVLEYRNPDGSKRRELRLPAEVFHADSLATLEHAPVIDIKDHTGMVTPETWRKVSLGHVVGVRQDGKYIASDLLVQDQETLDAIDRGDRTEISCGYECRLDMTPGVYEGEPYDCVQRGIRYNHAALCPPNRGRAGPDVGLRFDQQQTGWATAHLDTEETAMTIKIKLDGKDYEVGSEAHLDKLDSMHKADLAVVQGKLDAADKAKDELQGRLDAEKKAAAKAKDDFIEEKKKAADEDAKKDDTKKSSVKSRMRKLVRSLVLRALGDEGDEDDEAKEKKLDGLVDAAFSDDGWKLHMVDAIKKSDPQFNADGKTEGYIEGRFDALDELAAKMNGPDNVVRVVRENAHHLDAADDNDVMAKSRKKRDDNAANAWKPPSTARGEK